MATLDEIADFVRQQTSYRGPLTEETELEDDLGVFGDDMADLIAAYAERFRVDVSGYLWYFHTGEEGQNIGALFFRPPYARVRQIPITLRMLHESANLGRWAVCYPEHHLPRYRVDIAINVVIIVAFVVGLVFVLVLKCRAR